MLKRRWKIRGVMHCLYLSPGLPETFPGTLKTRIHCDKGKQRGVCLHAFAYLVQTFSLIAIECNHKSWACASLWSVFAGTVQDVGKGRVPLDRRMGRGGSGSHGGDCEELGSWAPEVSSAEITCLVWLPGTTRSKREKNMQESKVNIILLPP